MNNDTLKKVGIGMALAVIGFLAMLGVFFVIVMLMPDEETTEASQSVQTVQSRETEQEDVDLPETEAAEEDDAEDEEEPEDDEESAESNQEEKQENTPEEGKDDTNVINASSDAAATTLTEPAVAAPTEDPDTGNNATVNIPQSDISDYTLRFQTVSLDNKKVTHSIFSDYDLTIVHLWGTYCSSCISGMGDYASFYNKLPDNVNLIGLVVDTYDGVDTNVSDAKQILGGAKASFQNIRISDDLYDISSRFQAIPSAFFVNRDGHIVGSLMEGARISTVKKELAKYVK